MILALLQASDDTVNTAVQAVSDAIGNGDWVLAAIAGVVVVTPLALKAFGKQVPFLDAGLNAVLSVAKRVRTKPSAPPPSDAEVDAAFKNLADGVKKKDE